MKTLIVKGIYLLKDSIELLKINSDNELDKMVLKTFEKHYLSPNKENLKDYSFLTKHNLDDDTQYEFYKDIKDVPYLGEIKTKILNSKSKIKSISRNNFESNRNNKYNSWIIHLKTKDNNDKENNIFLFQSFFKQHMYITKDSSILTGINMGFLSESNNFTIKETEPSRLTLKENIDAVYLGGDKLFVINYDKYKKIFNYHEVLKEKAKVIYKKHFNNKSKIFNISENENVEYSMIENIKNVKRIILINDSGFLDTIDIKKIKNILPSYGIPDTIIENGKLNITPDNLDLILDILNENYTKCEYSGNTFQVKAKIKTNNK